MVKDVMQKLLLKEIMFFLGMGITIMNDKIEDIKNI